MFPNKTNVASWPASARYGIAIISVIVGWLAREALTPGVGQTALPFIFFFPAVAIAAWIGGFGPGLLAIGLSMLAANWFFIAPTHTFSIGSIYDVVALAAFAFSALVIIGSIEAMHRARGRAMRELVERKRAELELAKARDLLATTVASIGDAVIVTDEKGNITFLNPEAEKLTGWKDSEAKGQSLPKVFHIINEQTRQVVENPVDKVFRTGNVAGLANHTLLVSKDGIETPIDDSAAPIRERDGPLFGVVLVFRDVTAQRQAQQTASRLAAIIEHSGDAIFTKNLEGLIQTWNPSAERLFGYRAEEIVGKAVTVLFPPDRLTEEDQIIERLRKGQPVERLETVRVAKDGRRIPVAVNISPLKNADGEMIGASKIIHDVSEIVAAREALIREKELLATTLASIGDAVIVTDAEGRVTFLNDEAERLTKWNNSDAAGQPLPKVFRIVNEKTRAPVENPVEKVLRLGSVVGLANHTVLISKDGTETPIDDSAAPIRRANGPLFGVVLVFRDFTERKNAEEAQAQLIRMLDSGFDAIVMRDDHDRITQWNAGANNLYGWTREEALGQVTHRLFQTKFPKPLEEILADVRRNGRWEGELLQTRKDGSVITVSSRWTLEQDGDHQVILETNSDITERKRAQETLRDSEAALRRQFNELNALYAAAPAGLCLIDRDFRYVRINDTLAKINGHSPEAHIGKTPHEIVPEIASAAEEIFRKVLRTGETVQFELSGSTPSSANRIWDEQWYPIHDADGTVAFVGVVVNDITERKKMERSLRENEALISAVLKQLPLGIGVMDLNGRWMVTNALMDKFVPKAIPSTSPERVSRWHAYDDRGKLIPPEDWPGKRAMRGETVVPGLDMVFTDDAGQNRWLRVSAAPLRDETGRIIGATCIVEDIDRIKRAQDKIAEQAKALESVNARLHGIIFSAMDAVITIDAHQRVVLFNPAAEGMFGLSAKDVIGSSIEGLMPGRFRSSHGRYVDAFGRTGESNRKMGALGAISGLRSNGEEFPIEASISQIEIAGERLFTVILRDITERKKAEEHQGRLAAIIENSEDAIMSKTLDSVITSWNPGAEALFGYSASEIVGRSIHQIIPTECAAEEDMVLTRLRAGESTHRETVRLRKDGRRVQVSITCSPIRNASGQVIGGSKIARDISLQKETEEKLRDAQRKLLMHAADLEATVAERTAKLQETVQELQSFSYSIAHDMRAPLRAMGTFAQLLLNEALATTASPEAKSYCERIVIGAGRLDNLINDALNYTKAVLQEFPLQSVDLSKLVRGLIDTYPNLHVEVANIKVDHPLPIVLGNESLLTQCFSNLLGNAVKFVVPGKQPMIRVWSEAKQGIARIWVEDKGIGIPKHAQPRLFAMFQKLDNQYEGTGIGLAIVRKVVERMGGKVGVDSEPSRGSRFWVELRVAPKKEII